MRTLAIAASLLVAAVTGAQDWAKAKVDASPRHLEWVELKNGDRKVKAFVAYPEKKEKTTVVVLIHEIMGLTDWVQWMADQLAAEGYIVVAPDFVSGMGPNGGRTDSFENVGKVREAISGLKPEQVTGDLNAAVDYAKSLPASNGKVVVGGFCWGGTQTFRYATNRKGLAAGLVFYGSAPTDPEVFKKIDAPIHGFYASNDARINAGLIDTEKFMKDAGKKFEPVMYEGAGHGFMRAGQMPDAQLANKQARDSAFARMLKILREL